VQKEVCGDNENKKELNFDKEIPLKNSNCNL
jgi:hypothetical protein